MGCGGRMIRFPGPAAAPSIGNGALMNYGAACGVLVAHQPYNRLRWLRRFRTERCRTCLEPWPCAKRRAARQVILGSASYVR
jgi:hypothetical protein